MYASTKIDCLINNIYNKKIIAVYCISKHLVNKHVKV